MKFSGNAQGIETYRVGVFDDAWRLWRDLRHISKRRGKAYPMTRSLVIRYFTRKFRRSWRRRSYWNGYLAEWHYCPEGVNHTRAGRGWTRRAALRSLGRHIVAANALPTSSSALPDSGPQP